MFSLFGGSSKRRSGSRAAKINRAKTRLKKKLKIAKSERELNSLRQRLIDAESGTSTARKKKKK